MKRTIMQCYNDTQDKSEEQITIWADIKHKGQKHNVWTAIWKKVILK